MTFAVPQLIPKKKEGGGQGLANWRTSPGLKPNTSPKPLPVDAVPAMALTEADDYSLHIHVPHGTTREAVVKVLLPEVGYATSHAYGYLMHINPPATIPLDREGGADSHPDSKNESLSGPALHFKTPKHDLVTTGGALGTPVNFTPDAPPSSVNKHGLPAMELPPPADYDPSSSQAPKVEEYFVAVYGTLDAAENAKHLVKVAWPRAVASITTRKRGTTNATLVLKGVPFQTRIDSLVENLTNHLSYKPSYARLHRSERGVFKCVVFLKFSTRVIAEHAKLELERITVGTRPLRVEFKKQQREAFDQPPTPAPASTNVSAPASIGTLPPPPAYNAQPSKSLQTLLGLPPSYSASNPASAPAAAAAVTALPTPYGTMESTLASIALGDFGGCVYTSAELKPDEIRYLAHLCMVTGLQLTTATPSNVPAEANISLLPSSSASLGAKTPEYLLVRKRPQANAPTSSPAMNAATPATGGILDRNETPKFTPRVAPTTPQWTAHTPSSLQPMDFRGIRHWKEVRQEATSQSSGNTATALGILRPMGPDSAAPFGAGRGRPAR